MPKIPPARPSTHRATTRTTDRQIPASITIQPPGQERLKSLGVESLVLTTLSMAGRRLRDEAGQEVGALEFPATGDPRPRRLQATPGPGDDKAVLQYQYRVFYRDHVPAFEARSEAVGDHLDLAGLDFGVLQTVLDATDLPWGVIDSARLTLRYENWERTIALSPETPAGTTVSAVLGRAVSGVLTYQLQLYLRNRDIVTTDWIQVDCPHGRAAVQLRSPLGHSRTTVTVALDDGIDQAVVRMDYVLRDAQERSFPRLIRLDRASGVTSCDWVVPANADRPGALQVVRADVTTGGNTSQLALHAVGADPLPGSRVRVQVGARGVTVG